MPPYAAPARRHHSDLDTGGVTEGIQAWSLFLPKCVKCQAQHYPQQMAAVCLGRDCPHQEEEESMDWVLGGGLGSGVRVVDRGQDFRDREKSAGRLGW